MPLLTTRAGASAKSYGLTGGGGFPLAYYLGVEGAANQDRVYASIPNPVDGGITLIGTHNDGSQSYGTVIWTDSLGAVTTAKKYAIGTSGFLQCGAYDSSGNLYVGGSASTYAVLLKIDSSKNLSWARKLDQGSSNGEYKDLKIGSDGAIYLCGKFNYGFTSGGGGALLAKYDSAGTNSWYKLGPNIYYEFDSLVLNSSNDIYVAGYEYNGYRGRVSKWNSGGTLQWQKYNTQANCPWYGIALDEANGYVHIVGDTSAIDGTTDAYWYRLAESTGNFSTTASWETTGNNTGDRCIFVGGYLYTTGWLYYSADPIGSNNRRPYIMKMDTNYNVQWQREFSYGARTANHRIGADALGNLYLSYYSDNWAGNYGLDDGLWAKVPNNGTKTGTYTLRSQSIVYQAASMTSQTNSFTTISTDTMTWANTLTAGTLSATETALTISSAYVAIP